MRRALAVTGVAALLGCAGPTSGPTPGAGARDAISTPGPGDPYRHQAGGTLRSEQITIELRDGPLQVRVTPLDPSVLRLTAPDTQRRLLGIADAQRQRLAISGDPNPNGGASLFLVSFFSLQAEQAFQPAALAMESGGQRVHPTRILPITPDWSEQRLQPQTAAVAVYAFDTQIPVWQPFTVYYAARSSDRWRTILPLLEAERARACLTPPGCTP